MRLYQDQNFEIIRFNGLRIDKIIVCYDAEEIEMDDEAFLFKDETNKLNLKNKSIRKIYCKAHFNNSKITIETSENYIHLQCKNPTLFDDGNCEIIEEKKVK